MNTQQRRPLLQPATREAITLQRTPSFRPCGRIAALSMVLLCSCSTLTPDQAALLSTLAGNAAQIGLQLLLTQRQEERTNVVAVVDAMKVIADVGPLTSRQTASLMRGLPVDALKGDRAELYRSGKRLVIYDNLRGKAFTVPDGLAGEAVARAVRQGMQRALAPMPPVPAKVSRNYQAATNTFVSSPALPVVQSPTPAIPAGKHSPRVGIYRVERKEGTNWIEMQSFTSGTVGEWRVRRMR